MADNNIEVTVVAKVDEAVKSIKGFADTSGKILGSLAPGLNLIALNQGLELAQKAFGFVKEAIQKPLEIALEGEALKALDRQFENLALNAGLVGSELKAGLRDAAAGLIDDTDIIKSASRALVTMGDNAKLLPQSLELARKATALFGGEVTQNFELINQAIASGQTRGIRQIGIIVDQEAAIKKYASSINATVSSLTEFGRQQAIANAIIATGEKNFKAADLTLNQTKNSFDRLKVSLNELGETLSKQFVEKTGSFFAAIGNGLASVVTGITDSVKRLGGLGKLPLTEQAEVLGRELSSVLEEIQRINSQGLATTQQGNLDALNGVARDLSIQLGEVNEKLRVTGATAAAEAAKVKAATGGGSGPTVDIEKLNVERAKYQTRLFEINAQESAIVQEGQTEQQRLVDLSQANILLEKSRFAEENAVLELARKNGEIATDGQLFLAQEAAQSLHNAKMNDLRKQGDTTGLALAKGFQHTVANGIAGGIQSMVTSLAKGENVFSNFGKFILGLIGDFAIQVGTTIIATGIAYSSLGDFTGTSPVIFGAALVALGSLLKAFSSGGGADTSSAGGGGVASIGSSASPEVSGPSNVVQKPGTTVNVNVQGNILDRKQAGLELVEIINEAFSSDGVTVARGATA